MTWLVYRSGSGREDNLTPRMPLLKEPAGTTDSFDWDSIHRAVQEILGTLTSWVLSRAPATAWKSGRSSARAFPLISYRVFYRLDGNDYDPVIVGVTVSLEGSIARVSGDISGTSLGASISMRDVALRFPHTRTLFSTPLASSRIVSSCQGRLCLTPSAIATSISLYAESMPVRRGVSAHAHGNREAVVR